MGVHEGLVHNRDGKGFNSLQAVEKLKVSKLPVL